MVLVNLCQAWSTLVKAQVKLNETGLLLKTPSGYVQQSPLLGIVNSCTDTVMKLSREFRFSRSSSGTSCGNECGRGLADARLHGTRLGRPPTAAGKAGSVRDQFLAGISKSKIARRLKIDRTSVRRLLEEKKS